MVRAWRPRNPHRTCRRAAPAGNCALAELVLPVPGLHVEQDAGDIDAAVGVARRPGIFVQQLLAGLGAGADQALDQLGPVGSAVIGLAIVANAAQIGGEIVAQEIAPGLGPIGVDHGDRDRQRPRLDQVVGLLETHREALVDELRGERRNDDRGVDRLVGERDGHLVERQDLDVDIRDGQPVGLQHLADLVGRDRALAVTGDDPALEIPEPGDLPREIGTDHQMMTERARDPVHHHGDGEILVQRVEIAGRDSALHHLQLVLGQERDHVGGRVEVLGLDLDAELLEVALLDRGEGGDRGDRFHHADLDGDVLGPSRGRAAHDGEQSKQHVAAHGHD